MPTYYYKCNKCHKNFEIKASLDQKDHDDSEIFKCPECGSTDLKHDLNGLGYIKNDNMGDYNSCASGCCGGTCG